MDMFYYCLPGGLYSTCYYSADGHIKFDPPVYEQRYTTVLRILGDPCWKTEFKKIVDFGCGEMQMLTLLRRLDGVEHIVEVDVDEPLLQRCQYRGQPLLADYLKKREAPLRVEIFKGSIDASVECLRKVDAVIAVEIIEHLYPDVLENIPFNIFGYMQPKLAIFSTPNSEFNELFGPLENGFRHPDHKFEWTRKQFKEWALNICTRFPNYNVAIIGVGKAPPNRKYLGPVTQIAIFARLDVLGKELKEPLNMEVPSDDRPEVQYKEIAGVDFPFHRDERTKTQKMVDEIHYHINRCRGVDLYFNREREIYQIPLSALMEYVANGGGNKDILLTILTENNYNVEGDFVVLTEEDSNELGEEEEYYSNSGHAEDAENDEELGATGFSNSVLYESEEDWD